MERSLRPIEPFVHLTQEATLDALGHTWTGRALKPC